MPPAAHSRPARPQSHRHRPAPGPLASGRQAPHAPHIPPRPAAGPDAVRGTLAKQQSWCGSTHKQCAAHAQAATLVSPQAHLLQDEAQLALRQRHILVGGLDQPAELPLRRVNFGVKLHHKRGVATVQVQVASTPGSAPRPCRGPRAQRCGLWPQHRPCCCPARRRAGARLQDASPRPCCALIARNVRTVDADWEAAVGEFACRFKPCCAPQLVPPSPRACVLRAQTYSRTSGLSLKENHWQRP